MIEYQGRCLGLLTPEEEEIIEETPIIPKEKE